MPRFRNRKSPARQRILDFIMTYNHEHGYAPSYREIMRGCKIGSTSVVAYHLDILEEEGLITRRSNHPRTINLVG